MVIEVRVLNAKGETLNAGRSKLAEWVSLGNWKKYLEKCAEMSASILESRSQGERTKENQIKLFE